MIRALLDTNIILDLFLDRQTFVKEAAALWMANEQGHFEGYIAAITPINLWYIARKTKDAAALNLDAIVTRNLKDFAAGAIPVFSPADFLKRLP